MAWQQRSGGEDGTTTYWVDSNTGATSMIQPTEDAPNFQTRPTANGGLETLDPTTGQWGPSYRVPGAGVSFVPQRLAEKYQAGLVTKNAPAQNSGGFFEDYALPAIIGGIATAGVGSMLGAGSLFGGAGAGSGAGAAGSAGSDMMALTYGTGSSMGGGANALAGTMAGTTGGGMDFGSIVDSMFGGGGATGGVGIDMSGNVFGAGGDVVSSGSGSIGDFIKGALESGNVDQLTKLLPNIPGGAQALKAIMGGGGAASGAAGAAGGGSNWLTGLLGSLGLGGSGSGSGMNSLAGIMGIGSGIAGMMSGQSPEEASKQYWANADPYGPNRAGQVNNLNNALATYQGSDPNALMGDPYKAARDLQSGATPIETDPSYKWRMQQGEDALGRRMAATGQTSSGAERLAEIQYGQGMASTEFNAAFGRDMIMGDAQAKHNAAMQGNLTGQETGLINTYGQLSGASQAPAQAGQGALQAGQNAQSTQAQNLANIMGGMGTLAGTNPAQQQAGMYSAMANLYNTTAAKP